MTQCPANLAIASQLETYLATTELERLRCERVLLQAQLDAIDERMASLRMVAIVEQYVPQIGSDHVYKCLCGERFKAALDYVNHQPECVRPRDTYRRPARASGQMAARTRTQIVTELE